MLELSFLMITCPEDTVIPLKSKKPFVSLVIIVYRNLDSVKLIKATQNKNMQDSDRHNKKKRVNIDRKMCARNGKNGNRTTRQGLDVKLDDS